jgi:hypothetical protein
VIDARVVWDTWRRILRSDVLVDAVLHPGDGNCLADALSPSERGVLTAYASTPTPTAFTVAMYRRGLVRNALNALRLAPLTRRLLYTSGVDVEAVAADYVRSVEYRDDGPSLWRTAAEFASHVRGLRALSHPARQDALALDAAAIALARRLGRLPPREWPDAVARHAARSAERSVANRAAAAASSGFDLTPWLEHPDDFDPDVELEPSPRYWLVYVPAREGGHRYAELSERAARLFDLLSAPRGVDELALHGGLTVDEVRAVIDALAELGVVVPEEVR